MYLVINKWVIAVKVSNFSGQYLRNHWTLDIGVLGYIGIVWPKEHSPKVRSFPPGTPCIYYRWGEIFRSRPDRLWGPPSLLYNGYRVFPGGKAAGAWRWPPTPPSSAEVKERVDLCLYSTSGPSWPVKGWTLPYLYVMVSIRYIRF